MGAEPATPAAGAFTTLTGGAVRAGGATGVAGGSAEGQYSSFLNLILPGVTAYGSTLASALLQITETGMLSVRISSVRGDFYLGNSFLRVHAWEPNGNVSVVEPGMLALILTGFGAAGLAFVRRRRTLGLTAA